MLCSQLCFWETREIGCQKRSCGFYHKLPRNIEGLFMPPTSDVQVKSDIIHYLPLKFVIPLMDSDEEDETEELDGVKREERVKTKEEEEEEKVILAVCRSAGDLYKLCEDNEVHEDDTPEGGDDNPRQRPPNIGDKTKSVSSCEKGCDNSRQETPNIGNKKTSAPSCEKGCDNSRQETPNIGDKKTSAPSCEKGNGESKSADNYTSPLHDNGSNPGKKPSKPHESPSNHERSTYWKRHQHFYRGNRERKSADNHATPAHDNRSDPNKKPPKPHESPSKHERSTYWKGHQHFYRGDYSRNGQRWRKQFWYTNCDEYYQVDKDNYDTYQLACKSPGKGWSRTYPTDIVWYQSNHKKGSEENKKVLSPHYEEKKKSTDNDYPSRKPPVRSQRKHDVSWDKNNENYQPFRKPNAETHWEDKVLEKNTGHKQNLEYSPSKEKNRNFMSKSKGQFTQRQPVIKKTDQEESRSRALKDSACKIKQKS